MDSTSNVNSDPNIHNSVAQPARKPPLWPWLAFLIFTFLFDASLHPLITHFATFSSNPNFIYSVMGVIGSSICGQWFLLMVICGLWGRTWISGYAWAAMLLVTGVLATNLGSLMQVTFIDRTSQYAFNPAIFVIAAFLNGILISAGATIAFRVFRGWRLLRQEDLAPSSSFGITDLIVGTALVALLIILGNDVKSFGLIATQTFWEPVVMLGAFACVLGLTAITPIVWTMFRAKRWLGLKLLTVIAINSAIFGCIGGSVVKYSESITQSHFKIIALGTVWGFGALSYFVIGLLMLRIAGFRLHTGKQTAAVPMVSASRVGRWIAPIGVFASLGLAHLLLVGFTISNEANELEFRRLQRDLADRGGEISRDSNGEVRNVKIAPGSTRDDLLMLVGHTALSTISLADTAIYDEDLDQLLNFDQLQSLDLSRTAITDTGLETLAKFAALQELSIAGTKCTADGIMRLSARRLFYRLDLSDMGLTDADLENIATLDFFRPQMIKLSRNPVTNAGIAKLLERQFAIWSYAGVNLTDCKVDESCLTDAVYNDLILDGTQITEAGFAAKLKTIAIFGTLSMDRTAVTDQILTSFTPTNISKLKFGETLITEQGLSRLGTATISELSLNAQKFTGAGFADWKPTIEKLDMSRSGVTDANIAHIVKLPTLYELSLRGTAITDACLGLLAKSNLLTIDLRGTQVTAAAIAKVDWGDKELKVSATQFTDDEFKFLLPLTNFTVE